ncbi:hypothetical protein GCM10027578_13900 [Spirosoma luteolum]
MQGWPDWLGACVFKHGQCSIGILARHFDIVGIYAPVGRVHSGAALPRSDDKPVDRASGCRPRSECWQRYGCQQGRVNK